MKAYPSCCNEMQFQVDLVLPLFRTGFSNVLPKTKHFEVLNKKAPRTVDK